MAERNLSRPVIRRTTTFAVMFDITGSDISNLGDADLRTLVARLAIAELRAKGYPRSSITAGGNQDAADGGLDVRVECPTNITDPDFVPKRLTGFQVKRPDMRPSAIREEMRPKGVLREVILELANASGAYVIVSSQGSVADKPLKERRQAMRRALEGVPYSTQLHTDFYDRERLATWVNEYPGISAWVRGRVGRPLSGWSGINDWEGGNGATPKPFLSDGKACLIDERSCRREHLAIAEGIACLRDGLRTPKKCIRLIGLSGLGKTRLVQALFEEGVGEDPLDSSLAVYTDYSEETNPTARDMARELIAHRQRAILVVDNCNPTAHSELARLCSSDASEVSLITVEYDVRDDEPEQTEVFRLQSASSELVTEWIKQSFPEVSQVDRNKIAEFSDGNFRIARALSETLNKGETLGRLKNSELFERIFRQRNQPDPLLLRAAEDLSLLYSINGVDVSEESELALVGAISGVGSQPLYEALVEMGQRGIVQARGPFRAILPHAIANPLAAQALVRIPSARFDQFCRTLTPRMLKSLSRRLGFLHDSPAAQSVVARWLQTDGPLGDLIAMGEKGFQVISNIAPVAPETVLAKLEMELDGSNRDVLLASSETHRSQWIRLIKAIGYDAHLFDRVVMLLARHLSADMKKDIPVSNRPFFSEFFHLYLSGTKAPPEQRRVTIKRLAMSDDAGLRRCAQIALHGLLKSCHFMSSGSYDFGARSRDWGWEPKINRDIWDWFKEAIALVIEIATPEQARVLLAGNFRGLWQYPGCRDALDHAATTFAQSRPWIEGWLASRATLRFDGKDMPEDVRTKLAQIIERVKPTDILSQARAVVINRSFGVGSWDIADGADGEDDVNKAWEKADKMAQNVGCALANDAATRREFIPELLSAPQAQRAFLCGRGLAEGADDLNTIWFELFTAYATADKSKRNATVLGGFICEARHLDPTFTSHALEAAICNADLLPNLPYLQARAGIDEEGIARLRRAISEGGLSASNFCCLADGSVSDSPSEPLASLLNDIATLSQGVSVALDILHMHFHCIRDKGHQPIKQIVLAGCDLLARADFNRDNPIGDYGAHEVISICLVGDDGRDTAEIVCANIRSALDSYRISSHELTYTLKSLFETQPFVALDTFLLPTVSHGLEEDFDKSPIESLDPNKIQQWANRDPDMRYPLLGMILRMFSDKNSDEENELSQLFVSLLEQAPDKQLFLGNIYRRLHPSSWCGSLAEVLVRRKAQVMKLTEHPNEQVRAIFTNFMPEIDKWIERERKRDRAEEQSFE